MSQTYVRGLGDFARPFKLSTVEHFPEAASQTFKRGDLLVLDSASTENRVKKAADNATTLIVGFAAEDANGVTGKKVGVWEARPHRQFRAPTFDTDAVDFSDIGQARALQQHATLASVWVVDTSDAANDSVVVEKYLPENNIPVVEGDLAAICVFHFDPKATIFGAGV